MLMTIENICFIDRFGTPFSMVVNWEQPFSKSINKNYAFSHLSATKSFSFTSFATVKQRKYAKFITTLASFSFRTAFYSPQLYSTDWRLTTPNHPVAHREEVLKTKQVCVVIIWLTNGGKVRRKLVRKWKTRFRLKLWAMKQVVYAFFYLFLFLGKFVAAIWAFN